MAEKTFTYVRIYADESGVSHFEDVKIELQQNGPVSGRRRVELFKPLEATQVLLNHVAGTSEFHNPSAPMISVVISGEVKQETSDGEVRMLRAGDVMLSEDVTGKGHRNTGDFVIISVALGPAALMRS